MGSTTEQRQISAPSIFLLYLQEYPWLEETQQEEEQVQCWSDGGPNSHLGAQQSSLCPGKKGFRRWKTPLTHSSPRERLYPIRAGGREELRDA